MATGKLERLQMKDGKNGKYFDAWIEGVKYGAFGKAYEALREIPEGAQVEYEGKDNGQYKNLVTVKMLSAPALGAGPSSKGPDPRDLSVYTSYAKDLMMNGVTKDPQEAVDFVFLMKEAVSKYLSPPGNPTTGA